MRELLPYQNEPRTHLFCAAHLIIQAWDQGFLAVLFNVIWNLGASMKLRILTVTTVFVDTRLWKTKQPWKRFQIFRHPRVLLTDRIEIRQSQPDSVDFDPICH